MHDNTTMSLITSEVLQRPRFTVGEYDRIAQAGILGEDDRVKLLDGDIVEMMPIGPKHAACVDRIAQTLFGRLEG